MYTKANKSYLEQQYTCFYPAARDLLKFVVQWHVSSSYGRASQARFSSTGWNAISYPAPRPWTPHWRGRRRLCRRHVQCSARWRTIVWRHLPAAINSRNSQCQPIFTLTIYSTTAETHYTIKYILFFHFTLRFQQWIGHFQLRK